MSAVVLSCLDGAGLMTPASADHHGAAGIELAAIAAPPERAKGAIVMDREGQVLKLGDNGWTRGLIPPHFQETRPMCRDAVWMEWADSHLNEKGYAGGAFEVCYMLAGDEGANNIDPYSEGQMDDSQWITQRAHAVLLVSGSAYLQDTLDGRTWPLPRGATR